MAAQIMEKLMSKAVGSACPEAECMRMPLTAPRDSHTEEEVRGPKPGQIVRAMAEKSYSNLEVTLTETLQKPNTTNTERLTD